MAELRKNWLKFMSDEEVVKLDRASRRVLTEVGVRLEDDEIKTKLMDQGCKNEKGRVQFTPEIIEETIAGLKNHMTFSGRNGEILEVCDGQVHTHTGGSIPFIYDLETGQKRDATLADLVDMAKVMNHLDNLSMPGALILPQDAPHQIGEIYQAATMFRHCMKPLSGSAVSTAGQAPYVADIYDIMRDAYPLMQEHPPFTVGVSPESPLYYPKEITDIMKTLAERNIPTLALVAPIVGFTSPMTISGGLTQMNACLLAYAIINRQINPETWVLYGARLAVANMRTAHSVWGVPEVGMMGACAVQLARHYGFVSDVYGYSATSCAHDAQMGAESAMNGLLPMLAGANIISGFGSFGSGYMSSFEDMIIDDEIIGMHLHIAKGIAVDEDRLAVDVIAQAMEGTDYFLQRHTLKYLRSGELFSPRVGLYGLVKQWEDEGSKTIDQMANERARDILADYEEEPLPEAVEKEIQSILDAAHKELVV